MTSLPRSLSGEPIPAKPGFLKTYGCTLLAVGVFPMALVCAGLWFVNTIEIPTGEDADKASEFRAALVQQMEPFRLKDLDNAMKMKPLRGGRGRIVFQGPVTYSKEELDLIRKEFDRLNTQGAFKLVLPNP